MFRCISVCLCASSVFLWAKLPEINWIELNYPSAPFPLLTSNYGIWGKFWWMTTSKNSQLYMLLPKPSRDSACDSVSPSLIVTGGSVTLRAAPIKSAFVQGLSTAGICCATNANYLKGRVWLGLCTSMLFSSCVATCTGQQNITPTMWFENHLHGVAQGDGVGSQNTQLLAQSRYCKQTEFLYMWDYLWIDTAIIRPGFAHLHNHTQLFYSRLNKKK